MVPELPGFFYNAEDKLQERRDTFEKAETVAVWNGQVMDFNSIDNFLSEVAGIMGGDYRSGNALFRQRFRQIKRTQRSTGFGRVKILVENEHFHTVKKQKSRIGDSSVRLS